MCGSLHLFYSNHRSVWDYTCFTVTTDQFRVTCILQATTVADQFGVAYIIYYIILYYIMLCYVVLRCVALRCVVLCCVVLCCVVLCWIRLD